MPSNDRGGLRAAFTNFKDKDAELRLLGRVAETPNTDEISTEKLEQSYPVATSEPEQPRGEPGSIGGLVPRPLLKREAVRQLSFRCPVSLAGELRRKAEFNQLEQQQIIVEGIRRVLAELTWPPEGWQE